MTLFPTHCPSCGVANEDHLAEEEAGRCDNAMPIAHDIFNKFGAALERDPDLPERIEIDRLVSEALALAYQINGGSWEEASVYVNALVPKIAVRQMKQLEEDLADLEDEIKRNPPERNQGLRQRVQKMLDRHRIGDDRT